MGPDMLDRRSANAANAPGAGRARASGCLLAALLAAAVMPGCLRKPEVRLHDIKIERMSFRKLDLVCSFKVLNPNAWDASLGDFDYTLSAAGQTVCRGAASKPIPKVPARGSAILPVRASIDLPSLVGVLRADRRGGPVPYRLSARPVFRVLGLPLGVDVDHVGQLPRLRPPRWKLQGVSLAPAPRRAIVLRFEIENLSGLDLSLEGLSGRLKLGDETVLQLDETSAAELPDGRKVELTVPVRVGVAAAFRAVAQTVSSGARLTFEGEFRLKSPASLRKLLLGKKGR